MLKLNRLEAMDITGDKEKYFMVVKALILQEGITVIGVYMLLTGPQNARSKNWQLLKGERDSSTLTLDFHTFPSEI